MTFKENALRIIRFNKPEQVVSWLPCYDISYNGVNHESLADNIGHGRPVGSKWTDIWGTEWHKEKEDVMGFPKGTPLAETAALKSYKWPDPNDERICSAVGKKAAQFDKVDKFISGSHRDTLWERSYMVVGMENMMAYFYTEPDFAREVLRNIMDFQLGIAKHYLAHGVEIVHMSDDLGTQTGPLLGPAIVNEFLVPEYRRLFDLYKQHKVLIGFHSCGNMDSVLETFIDLGVDALNPVQATANDLPALRKKAGKRIAFMGGISTGLIMDGPVEKIRKEVKLRISELGSEGGYFCAPDQGMPFPEAHRKAFNEAVVEFGRYPLN